MCVSSPDTWRKTERLIFGSVFTWHWYSPISLSWVYRICRVQLSDISAWRHENRLSPVKVITLLVRTWRDRLRIHETCNRHQYVDKSGGHNSLFYRQGPVLCNEGELFGPSLLTRFFGTTLQNMVHACCNWFGSLYAHTHLKCKYIITLSVTSESNLACIWNEKVLLIAKFC